MRGSRNQPPIASAATTNAPCHSAVSSSSALSPPALGANAPSTTMIGTIARSSNSSIEKDAVTTADLVPAIGTARQCLVLVKTLYISVTSGVHTTIHKQNKPKLT